MPAPPPPWVVELSDEESKLKVRADLMLLKTDSSLVTLSKVFTAFNLTVEIKKLDIIRNSTDYNKYHYIWETVSGREWDQEIRITGPGPADYFVSLDDLTGEWTAAELTTHVNFRASLVAFCRSYAIDTINYNKK